MPAVEQLCGLLVALSRSLSDVSASSLLAVHAEVTPNQYRALVVLDEHGQMSVAHFARCCAIDRSTATRLCDRLVKKGLIDRERSFRDRRSVNVVLTPSARNLLESVARYRMNKISEVIHSVPVASHQQLIESLELVASAVSRSVDAENTAAP